jgi:predicted site-specific integrase-resolvase
MEKLFTVTEAGKIFRVSRAAVDRWMQEGKLKKANTTGHPRFTEEEINRFIYQNGVRVLVRANNIDDLENKIKRLEK